MKEGKCENRNGGGSRKVTYAFPTPQDTINRTEIIHVWVVALVWNICFETSEERGFTAFQGNPDGTQATKEAGESHSYLDTPQERDFSWAKRIKLENWCSLRTFQGWVQVDKVRSTCGELSKETAQLEPENEWDGGVWVSAAQNQSLCWWWSLQIKKNLSSNSHQNYENHRNKQYQQQNRLGEASSGLFQVLPLEFSKLNPKTFLCFVSTWERLHKMTNPFLGWDKGLSGLVRSRSNWQITAEKIRHRF